MSHYNLNKYTYDFPEPTNSLTATAINTIKDTFTELFAGEYLKLSVIANNCPEHPGATPILVSEYKTPGYEHIVADTTQALLNAAANPLFTGLPLAPAILNNTPNTRMPINHKKLADLLARQLAKQLHAAKDGLIDPVEIGGFGEYENLAAMLSPFPVVGKFKDVYATWLPDPYYLIGKPKEDTLREDLVITATLTME